MLRKGYINHKKLRKDVREIMFNHGSHYIDVAQDLGYTRKTLNSYLTGGSESATLANALVEYFDLDAKEYSTV